MNRFDNSNRAGTSTTVFSNDVEFQVAIKKNLTFLKHAKSKVYFVGRGCE